MTTPEGKIKNKLRGFLKSKQPDMYWFMPVQTGMGKRTLDFLCCYRSRFIAIETKAPGKQPTPIQRTSIIDIGNAKGLVFIIDSEDFSALERWLDRIARETEGKWK